MTLLRIDLDRFKYVNDTMGHAAGDEVLCRVADLLRNETRREDLPVRVGGDEFVILVSVEEDATYAWRVAERLRRAIGRSLEIDGKTVRLGASFGVASTADGFVSIDDILVAADAALYIAKDGGRNRIEHYCSAVHAAVVQRRTLSDDIRAAVENASFVPYFQPQIDAQTGCIVGVEALVRWPRRSGEVMTPDQFLPAAEQLGLVPDIDAIVLDKSFEAVSKLRTDGLDVGKVAFNVTLARLEDPLVLDLVRRTKPPGLSVAFEVLESVLIDTLTDHLAEQIAELRKAGVSIEMDDFGSGHASLIAVRQARPDAIKIDRRLVFPIVSSREDQQIVKSIVEIGKALDIKVIAEGVETVEHADLLRALGCDTFQGYYLARPMPLEQLADYLRRQRDSDAA